MRQQLLALLSCLAGGHSKLNKEGLLALGKKLELEDHHRDVIFELLEIDIAQEFIVFYEFQNKILLLGKSQEGPVDSSKQDVNGKSLNFGCKMNNKEDGG